MGSLLQADDEYLTHKPATTLDKVNFLYDNDQEMVAIINCESGFRQYTVSGTPLISPTSDVGIMQINQVHWKRAESLGLDIFHSINDNLIMGYIIYSEQGKNAWTCHLYGDT